MRRAAIPDLHRSTRGRWSLALGNRTAAALVPLEMRLSWLEARLRYRGSRNDVFVVAYPESGSNWLQMLLYQLMTDGPLDAAAIQNFCPSLENVTTRAFAQPFEAMMAADLCVDDLPEPRVLRSYAFYPWMLKGPGRYIYAVRHGLDVAVSLYQWLARHVSVPGQRDGPAVPPAGGGHPAPAPTPDARFERFLDRFLSGRLGMGSWVQHVAGWAENRANLDVLYVSYDDLASDLETTTERVARFCGIQPATIDWPRVLSRCSAEAMEANTHLFDPHAVRPAVAAEDAHYVRRGQVGEWRSLLTPPMRRAYEAQYDRNLASISLPRSFRGDA